MFTMSSSGKSVGKQARGTRARSIARKLAMQALYQWQLTQQTAAEIKQQFLESEDAALQPFIDRPLAQLDPVETAILMIGMFELQQRVDIPYRVVINEAVDLTKRFGATDAHKYVNAVLDRAARELRPAERE